MERNAKKKILFVPFEWNEQIIDNITQYFIPFGPWESVGRLALSLKRMHMKVRILKISRGKVSKCLEKI